MLDKKWLTLAGMFNHCIYDRTHSSCPYAQIRLMDQVEKLEKIQFMKSNEAAKLMSDCRCLRDQCHHIVPFSKESLRIREYSLEKHVMTV